VEYQEDLWPSPCSSLPFVPPTHPPTWAIDYIEPSADRIHAFRRDVKAALSELEFAVFQSQMKNYLLVGTTTGGLV